MTTVTVNTLEFVSALRALIPVSKQATLYSGEKERNAATIAARITPAKKLALITGNSALGAVASVRIEQAVETGECEFCLYTDDAKNITSIFKPNKQNSEEPLRLEFGDQLDNENIMIAETHKAYGNTELLIGNLTEDAEITDTLLNDLYLSVNNPEDRSPRISTSSRSLRSRRHRKSTVKPPPALQAATQAVFATSSTEHTYTASLR